METTKPSSYLENLSVELKQTILSGIADIISLRAAALSCPALYSALLSAENHIVTRVLLNKVDFGVLPEAIIVQEALHLEPCSEKLTQEFVARHLNERHLPPKKWSLCDAIRIAKLHACVSELALQFIETVTTKSSIIVSRSVTRAEICRIERALYRFETFCNLFRGFGSSHHRLLERLFATFFFNFSPWEIEQLACVHDYLVQMIYPAFNDVTEHDIDWGEFMIRYGSDRDSLSIQNILSRGLEKLRQLSIVKTYEARYELLEHHPGSRYPFLYSALIDANGEYEYLCLSDFTSIEGQSRIRPPFFNDPDSGPADIWWWAHPDEPYEDYVDEDDRVALREWGYVMWDRARLDNFGIFQNRWEPSCPNDEELRAKDQHYVEMMASFHARSKIWLMGGSGWWSPGDHSKIVWREDSKIKLSSEENSTEEIQRG